MGRDGALRNGNGVAITLDGNALTIVLGPISSAASAASVAGVINAAATTTSLGALHNDGNAAFNGVFRYCALDSFCKATRAL